MLNFFQKPTILGVDDIGYTASVFVQITDIFELAQKVIFAAVVQKRDSDDHILCFCFMAGVH